MTNDSTPAALRLSDQLGPVPANATEPMQRAMQRAVLLRKSMNDVWRAALYELPDDNTVREALEAACGAFSAAEPYLPTGCNAEFTFYASWEDVKRALDAMTPAVAKQPCGECHLQPGERCDVCGASSGA